MFFQIIIFGVFIGYSMNRNFRQSLIKFLKWGNIVENLGNKEKLSLQDRIFKGKEYYGYQKKFCFRYLTEYKEVKIQRKSEGIWGIQRVVFVEMWLVFVFVSGIVYIEYLRVLFWIYLKVYLKSKIEGLKCFKVV